MPKKITWSAIEPEPECYVLYIQERVLTWHYKAGGYASPKVRPVAPGLGEYANHNDAVKLTLKTKRRRKGFIKIAFALEDRPRWFVSLVYPRRMAKKMTPDQLRKDLAFIGRKFRTHYHNGYAIYLIDYTDKARFHLHLLARCGKSPARKSGDSRPGFRSLMKEWWFGRVGSSKKNLVEVKNLRFSEDSYAACSYMVSGEKLQDHRKVTSFMGNRHSFGCFNEHNLKLAKPRRIEIPPEAFPEIRKVICFDVHEDSRHSDGSYLADHESKVLHAGAGLHIISDPTLEKKIKRKLLQRLKLERGE